MDDRILYLPTLGQKFSFGTDNSFTENVQEDMEIYKAQSLHLFYITVAN